MKKGTFLKALNFVLVLCLLVPVYWAAPAHAENTLIQQSDFEDGTVQGWSGRGEVEVLTVKQMRHAAAHILWR